MKTANRHKELETILVLVLMPVIFFLIFKKQWLLTFSLAIGFTSLLIPAAGRLIHELWIKIAAITGIVMNGVILAIIFIVVVIPLGWLSKKTGKSSVILRPGNTSYFKDRNHTYTKKDMENMW